MASQVVLVFFLLHSSSYLDTKGLYKGHTEGCRGSPVSWDAPPESQQLCSHWPGSPAHGCRGMWPMKLLPCGYSCDRRSNGQMLSPLWSQQVVLPPLSGQPLPSPLYAGFPALQWFPLSIQRLLWGVPHTPNYAQHLQLMPFSAVCFFFFRWFRRWNYVLHGYVFIICKILYILSNQYYTGGWVIFLLYQFFSLLLCLEITFPS